MDWTLVALSQMCLITIGVSVALGLRIRAVGKQNTALREHAEVVTESVADLEANQNPAPEVWVAETIDGLDPDDVHAPLLKLVLAHAVKRNRKFAKELPDAVAACGLVPQGEGGRAVGEDQSEDLKNLLQQFTKDSREMMACIQTLEKENAALREQLGEDAPPIEVPADPPETVDEVKPDPADAIPGDDVSTVMPTADEESASVEDEMQALVDSLDEPEATTDDSADPDPVPASASTEASEVKSEQSQATDEKTAATA